MKSKQVLFRRGVTLNQNMSAIPATFSGEQFRHLLANWFTEVPLMIKKREKSSKMDCDSWEISLKSQVYMLKL